MLVYATLLSSRSEPLEFPGSTRPLRRCLRKVARRRPIPCTPGDLPQPATRSTLKWKNKRSSSLQKPRFQLAKTSLNLLLLRVLNGFKGSLKHPQTFAFWVFNGFKVANSQGCWGCSTWSSPTALSTAPCAKPSSLPSSACRGLEGRLSNRGTFRGFKVSSFPFQNANRHCSSAHLSFLG